MSVLLSYAETWLWFGLVLMFAEYAIKLRNVALAASLAAFVLAAWLWLMPYINAYSEDTTQAQVNINVHIQGYKVGEAIYTFMVLWLLMLLLGQALRVALYMKNSLDIQE